MKNQTKTIVFIALFIIFILISSSAYNRLSSKFKPNIQLDTSKYQVKKSNSENIPAADFTAYDTNGNIVNLSNYFGKPIVLNFWASWCPPCKDEMPYFDKVYNEMRDDVTFLMVDIVDGTRETEAKGKQYIADNNFTFPVLFDLDSDAVYTYGISSIPSTIFIDKDGFIVTKVRGGIDEKTLREGISLISK